VREEGGGIVVVVVVFIIIIYGSVGWLMPTACDNISIGE
jgi:hypothetical protein